MKKLYTLILLASLNFSFAQDPQLFQNFWFLQNVIIDGVDNFPPNSNMYLNFDSATYFHTKACNTMAGQVAFENNFTNFSASNYTFTLDMCLDTAAENYQNTYFPFFGEENGTSPSTTYNFTYTITEALGLKTLIITSEFNQQAIYTDIILSKQQFEKEAFSFYPNPSEDFIEINLNNTLTNNTTLDIYNNIGILHKTEKLTANTTQIYISNLASGIYFLKITSENGISVKKLIKK
ncbi:T9SS type A sorting domain-containing protein [Flavobacterium sp.]|uniref:T9SS type A sorting domain-containing protein n=1 Tax=Flavobacterium sp. TaxID=239 RepID=UPI00260C413C|nr:T9SS type A sorting domain-containing protein [Flavobacterium sp.]MDD3003587.1 T9SS type A sorting domain-containing protein [Flavobacterium sp.]